MGSLVSENREVGFSKGQLDKWRKQGKIPAVVFGKSRTESFPVWVNWRSFEKFLHTEGKVFELQVNGKTELVNTKEIDWSPLGQPLHISFHQIQKGQAIEVKVPVHLVGTSAGQKAGGVVQVTEEQVLVKGLPKHIPEHIDLDISALEIGHHITAAELKLPQGLELAQPGDHNLVVCQAPKQEAPEEVVELHPEGEAPVAAAPESDSDKLAS